VANQWHLVGSEAEALTESPDRVGMPRKGARRQGSQKAKLNNNEERRRQNAWVVSGLWSWDRAWPGLQAPQLTPREWVA